MEPIVIARAPLNVSLGEHAICVPGGPGNQRVTIRAAINYYAYTIVTSAPGDAVQIIWGACPTLPHCGCRQGLVAKRELGLPEAISQKFNVRNGLKIFLAPQVPLGEGLGLTGSLAVSMIKALALCAGIDLEPQEVAEFACQVADSARTASPLKADPFASAYGGLNAIETKASQPIVKSIHLASDTREALEKSLMLFRIDSIDPSSVSSPARRRLSPYKAQLDYESDGHGSNGGEEVPDVDVVAALQHGDLVAFGHSLHRSWLEDPCGRMDRGHVLLDYYRIAREVGALGGRGEVASGHGFLVLCCREEDQGRVTDALVALGMKRWPLRLASEGVEVLEAIPRAWSKLTSTTSLLSAEAL